VARRLALVAAALALVGAWLVLRRERPPVARPAAVDRDLLLVTLDTTRADRLGCYGYARARTKRLDRLAAEGVRFAQATSPAPITLPAHASIFTGLNPPTHGVRNNGNFYLSERFETLATAFKSRGYTTAAFVSSFILDRRYGLARGFDHYDDAMGRTGPRILALEAERRGDHTTLALTHWLETRPSAERVFLWLHLYDPHEPYRPPPPFREVFADDAYDGEIAFADAAVAATLDALARAGRLERTVVAVIADHGESLGDHGEETHSMLLYESAIRVPFLLWGPGLVPSGRVVEESVRAIDLAPTLLDLMGGPPLPRSDGRSLRPLIEGRASEPSPGAYAETLLPQLYMNWAPLRSLRDSRFKLIDAPDPELYDLLRDPAEQTNLFTARPELARALRAALAEVQGGEGAMSVGTLDRETIEKLAALGYLGAGHAAAPSAPQAGADPKRMIGVFNRLRRANSAVRDKRFADALPILREVLAEDPKNAFATLVMGSAHMVQGDNATAIRYFRRYLELVPTSSYAHLWLAICHVRRGEQDLSLREAEAALALDPRFSDARVLKAGILASRGRHAEAVAELQQAVLADPAKAILRLDLAKVLAEAGRPDEAAREYKVILEREPDHTDALIGLAALDAERGRLAAAEAGLRRALGIAPEDAAARFNLARVLEAQGRRDEAREAYRLLAESDAVLPSVRQAARAALARLSP